MLNIEDVLNICCLVFTFAGAIIIANIGDKLYGWAIYVVSAIFGVSYFSMTGNTVQLLIWCFFLTNDVLAIRRIKKKQARENLCS
jgi:hypothetical protein